MFRAEDVTGIMDYSCIIRFSRIHDFLTLPRVLHIDLFIGQVGHSEVIVVFVFGARRSRQCSDEDDQNLVHGKIYKKLSVFLIVGEHEK
jgi:hypothetical protein